LAAPTDLAIVLEAAPCYLHVADSTLTIEQAKNERARERERERETGDDAQDEIREWEVSKRRPPFQSSNKGAMSFEQSFGDV
jgi:hypothetical protein